MPKPAEKKVSPDWGGLSRVIRLDSGRWQLLQISPRRPKYDAGGPLVQSCSSWEDHQPVFLLQTKNWLPIEYQLHQYHLQGQKEPIDPAHDKKKVGRCHPEVNRDLPFIPKFHYLWPITTLTNKFPRRTESIKKMTNRLVKLAGGWSRS